MVGSFTTDVLAYVGPGPGLTMFWAFVVLIGTVLLALLSVLAWPLRIALRKLRAPKPGATPADASSSHLSSVGRA